MSGREMINLDGDLFARAIVERALGRLLLERVERLEPIQRIAPLSGLVYKFRLDDVTYHVTLRVAER